MEKVLRQFIEYQTAMSISPFGNGHINHTFRVEVFAGGKTSKYVLQRINHHVFKDPEGVMENIRVVAEHLSAQNYPLKILRPIPTHSGSLFYRDDEGRCWRMFPYFENTFTPERVGSAEHAYEAAKAFGMFTKALHGIDISGLKITIPHFHDGLYRMRVFREITKKADPERLKKAQKEVKEVLENEQLLKKIANQKFPLRAVHHDTKINNLLFDEKTGKAVAVIDLDTVMPGTVLSDFGDLVRTSVSSASEDERDWTKVDFRPQVNRALMEGFLEGTGNILTAKEKTYLGLAGPWLTLMQVVRFLTDYLGGDVYYRIKYPDHNLVRTRCQLQLFREMKNGEKQLPR